MTTKSMMKTLSNRLVRKLTVEKDTVFWDSDLTGFGVRVYPTGSKVYVAQARDGGPLRESAERVAESIAEDLLQENPPEHIAPVAPGHRPAKAFPPRCGTTSKSGRHPTPSSAGKALHK